MTIKRVTWIADDLNEWTNPRGGVIYFVNVAFDDNDTGSIGKKQQDEALELQGLLRENCLNKEVEFGLESTGKKNKDGGDKWKVLSFPGYEPKPYTPNSDGGSSDWKESWYSSEDGVRFTQDATNCRTALMQAVELCGVGNRQDGVWVLSLADGFYDWLTARPGRSGHGDVSDPGTSSPPSAAIATAANTPSGRPTSSPVDQQALLAGGAGSAPASPAAGEGTTSAAQTECLPAGEDSPEAFGEGDSGCPPHQLNKDVAAKAGRYPCLKCGAWAK